MGFELLVTAPPVRDERPAEALSSVMILHPNTAHHYVNILRSPILGIAIELPAMCVISDCSGLLFCSGGRQPVGRSSLRWDAEREARSFGVVEGRRAGGAG